MEPQILRYQTVEVYVLFNLSSTHEKVKTIKKC